VLNWYIHLLLIHLRDHRLPDVAIARQRGGDRSRINRWLAAGQRDSDVETPTGPPSGSKLEADKA